MFQAKPTAQVVENFLLEPKTEEPRFEIPKGAEILPEVPEEPEVPTEPEDREFRLMMQEYEENLK